MKNKPHLLTKKGLDASSEILITDVSKLIDQTKNQVAREYNSTQIQLCWLIGRRINEEMLKYKRAEYGQKIIDNISVNLSQKYGRGYSRPNLFRMLRFSKFFEDLKIVSTVSRQLSWSHLLLICAIDDSQKRDFYTEMCRIQHLSVRGLKKQIDSMLYERTAISKKPEKLIKKEIKNLQEKNQMTSSMIFKDPYFLNFVNIEDSHSEEDLENSILNQISEFLQELGTDFCFVARQKRMSTQKKDRYLDLLFYNRRLKRLIAIDLKIGEFEPAYKGQMEWYLKWLEENEVLPGEKKPLGIILCSSKDEEDIKYLELDKSGIHVAQYFTELPPKELLESKLREAINTAKEIHLRKQVVSHNNYKLQK